MKRYEENTLWGLLLFEGKVSREARQELTRRANRWFWLRRIFNKNAKLIDPLHFGKDI